MKFKFIQIVIDTGEIILFYSNESNNFEDDHMGDELLAGVDEESIFGDFWNFFSTFLSQSPFTVGWAKIYSNWKSHPNKIKPFFNDFQMRKYHDKILKVCFLGCVIKIES